MGIGLRKDWEQGVHIHNVKENGWETFVGLRSPMDDAPVNGTARVFGESFKMGIMDLCGVVANLASVVMA
jgi:hypothetical protein